MVGLIFSKLLIYSADALMRKFVLGAGMARKDSIVEVIF